MEYKVLHVKDFNSLNNNTTEIKNPATIRKNISWWALEEEKKNLQTVGGQSG